VLVVPAWQPVRLLGVRQCAIDRFVTDITMVEDRTDQLEERTVQVLINQPQLRAVQPYPPRCIGKGFAQFNQCHDLRMIRPDRLDDAREQVAP
jgi:hypothetical protein